MGKESTLDFICDMREVDQVSGSQAWLQVGTKEEPLKYTSALVLLPSGTELIGMVGYRQGYYLKALGFSNVQPKLRTTS